MYKHCLLLLLFISSQLMAFGETPCIENRAETIEKNSIDIIVGNKVIARGHIFGDDRNILIPRNSLLITRNLIIKTDDGQTLTVNRVIAEDKIGNMAVVKVTGIKDTPIYKFNIDDNSLSPPLYVADSSVDTGFISCNITTIAFINGFGSIFSHSISSSNIVHGSGLFNSKGDLVGINQYINIKGENFPFTSHIQRLLIFEEVAAKDFDTWFDTNSSGYENSFEYKFLSTLIKEYQGDFSEALRILNTIPETHAEHMSLVYWHKGVCHLNLDQIASAKQSFRNAIKIDEKHYDSYASLSDISLQENNYNSASLYAKKLIQLQSENPLGYYQLALINTHQNNLSSAEEYYKQTIQKEPGHFLAYNDLGHLYTTQNKYKDAKYYLKKAIEINPNYSDPHYNLGLVYENLKQTEKAIKEYKIAEVLNPFNPDPPSRIALLNIDSNNYNQAKMYILRAINIDNNNYYFHYLLGWILSENKEYSESNRAIINALKIKSYYQDAYLVMAENYSQPGNFNRAENSLREGIRNCENKYALYNKLGLVMMKQEKYQEAIAVLKKAVSEKPNLVQAHYNLSESYAYLGDKQMAVQEYRILKKLNEQNANYLYHNVLKKEFTDLDI